MIKCETWQNNYSLKMKEYFDTRHEFQNHVYILPSIKR